MSRVGFQDTPFGGMFPFGKEKQKSRGCNLCFSSMLVVFLLSPKGPPSCWRAKPIVKAIQLELYLVAEHSECSSFVSIGEFSKLSCLSSIQCFPQKSQEAKQKEVQKLSFYVRYLQFVRKDVFLHGGKHPREQINVSFLSVDCCDRHNRDHRPHLSHPGVKSAAAFEQQFADRAVAVVHVR